MSQNRTAKNNISKYSAPAPVEFVRNEFLPELIVMLEKRATRSDFEGCGVLVAIIKSPINGYTVQVGRQYQSGGKQQFVERKHFTNLRDAYKFANEALRTHYHKVAENKFAVDILGLSDVGLAKSMFQEIASNE